jgi:two-component system, chemotaxis family, chemotaxis protein CheY
MSADREVRQPVEMVMQALVIDDSRTTRMIIGKILRELGMEVFEAADGLDALEQLKRNPDVELLLVDWNMPQMNGFDFLQRVRAERAYDGVRILMVTSEAQTDHVARALGAGANEYLMKPFNKDVLIAKLNLMDVLQG